jgi:prepilin-type N-terminal cleavage/methylation domain-containing protein
MVILRRPRFSAAPRAKRVKASQGFTLVELMVGLVLMSILAGIGVPMFRSFILDQRLRATSTDLRIALVTARSESVKRNRTVELQPSDADWGTGWTIPNPVGGRPDILNQKQMGDIAISGPTEVEFTPMGRTLAAAEFQIDVGPESNGASACLQLQLDGRATSIKGVCP